MLSIQAVITPGKAEYFKGVQYTPKGQPFTEVRANIGSKDKPRWHSLTIYGSEAQLEAVLRAMTKPEGGFTSLLVKGPARPRTYITTVVDETGEIMGQKEHLAFSIGFERLQVYDNTQKAWVEAHKALEVAPSK